MSAGYLDDFHQLLAALRYSPRRHSPPSGRIGRFSGSLGDGISMRNPKIFGSSYQVPVLETSKTVACTCHLCRVPYCGNILSPLILSYSC